MRETPDTVAVTLGVLSAAAIGAALTFLLDPAEGQRRRARVRKELAHVAERAEDAAGTASRDLGQRARGAVAELRARFASGRVSDEVLLDRVRARIDAVLEGPSAVRASVANGRVVLSGPVLAEDVDRLVRRVRAVRGVAEVDHELEVYAEPGNVPGLQAARRRTGRADVLHLVPVRWAPTLGSLAALASATAALVLLGSVGRRES